MSLATNSKEPVSEPETEIEATLEMIEAGSNCLWRHPLFDAPSEEEMKILVADLFKAMIGSHPKYRI